MEISIVVPVYNTEYSLFKRCLSSVIKLKKINYEILVIDDGSDENYSKKYENIINDYKSYNIKYIRKENGGVSSARNLGIKMAIGKYIMFVDSDDTINANIISSNDVKKNNDIIFYNRVYIKDSSVIYDKIDFLKPGKVDYLFIMKNLLKSKNFFYGPVAKLYSLNFLIKNKILFDKNIIHGEDMLFNLNLLINKPNIYYIDKNLYNYYYSPSTSINRWLNKQDIMFDNKKYLFIKKIKVINSFPFNNKQELIDFCTKNYIDSSFSLCVRLYKKDDFWKNFLVKTRNNMECINIRNTNLNFISKLKFYFICKKKWIVFKILNIFFK